MFTPFQIGSRRVPYLLAIVLGAASYFLASELGLSFAILHKSVSPLWPASGIGLVLMIIGGRRFWPAIWIGAYLASTFLDGRMAAPLIATGNMLEVLIGAEIVRRFDQYRSDGFFLLRGMSYLLTSVVAPMVSAGIGAIVLYSFNLVGNTSAITLFITWWASDALGILILAPALLSLMTPAVAPASAISRTNFLSRLFGLGIVLALSFFLSTTNDLAVAIFLTFPIVLLSIKWFGVRGGAWVTLLVAVVLLVQTMMGAGAFAGQTLNDRLLDAQVFIGALAFTALVFSDLRADDIPLASWVFGIGCGLAAIVFAISNQVEAELVGEHFDKVAEAATDGVRQRMQLYADWLEAGSAFVAASPHVSRQDWLAYTSSLNLTKRYPGINGIGLIVPVSPAKLGQFIADTRRDGAPDFTVRSILSTPNPRSPDEDHLIILYLDPIFSSTSPVGLDLSTETNRRRAALAAKELGRPQITDPIAMIHDAQQRSGFLLYVPIYQPGLPVQTAEERAAAFRGLIYAPFVTEQFFREALRNWNREVEAEIFNGDSAAGLRLFTTIGPEEGAVLAKRQSRDLPISVFGHRFTARVWPGEAFAIERQRAGIVLGAGLTMLATLLAALIANLQSMKDQARIIATRMTEALALSTERFELAIAGSQDGIWDWNLEDGKLWTSPRCSEMLGYESGEIVARISAWRSLLHPDDFALTIDATRDLLGKAVSRLDIVQRFRHRDGRFVHVHNRALAVYRSDGRATRVIGALTDITPLLRAEERLRTAISVIDSGFALFDAEDRLVLFNDGFLDENLRDLLPDPTGHTFAEIFSTFAYGELTAVKALPDRGAWLQDRIDLHRNPSPEPFEIEWTDGRWMRVFERRLSDGGTVAVWTDVTNLKAAERRLYNAIESINEAFALFDPELRYVMLNSHLRDMYPMSGAFAAPGRRLEDALRYGASHGEYPDVETPEEVEAFVQHWMAIFSSDQPYLGEGMLKDGRWLLISHHRTADGGYVSVRADITAQKQREAELELAKQQLEDKTTELTRLAEDLDRARRVADEANRGKSRFLANTSHELRTPLTAILGFSDVMANEIFGRIDPPVYREYIDLIHESGEHLLSLINDILDLSKIEAGKMTLDIGVVSTAELLRQSSSLMRVMATERGIDLVIDPAQDCPILHADERAARQIVLNLLSNAIKFTPRGGRVTLAVHPIADKGIEISVTDTGIGMTPDEAERALQLYVQVDSDVARMALGTGIGLPLVKALAELHGGAIDVSSRKRYGTTVTVVLPWQNDLPRDVPALPSPAAPQSTERDRSIAMDLANKPFIAEDPFHVLVVEDNEINQSLITVILNRMSLQVDCAPDGLTGVELAAAKRYDLVIMDVQMPRLDGIEATRQIRDLGNETSLAPIIALTADAEGIQRERCLAAGMTEVLAKPIMPPLLIATVTRLLQKRAMTSIAVH